MRQFLSKQMTFDAIRDFTPITLASINKADIERAAKLVKAAGIQPE